MADDNFLFDDDIENEPEELPGGPGHDNQDDSDTVPLPGDSVLRDAAYMFKMMGDLTRVKILSALSVRELCVQNIADTVKISQSAVSHQLRLLRTGKLVKYRKVGKQVFYSLENELVKNFLNDALKNGKIK